VGTHLITSKGCASFGGVYKLAAIKRDGAFLPKIKISENTEKITNPGNKTIYRVYEKESGMVKADIICFANETYDETDDLLLFDPVDTWKKTKLKGGTYTLREILVPIFTHGSCVYDSPSVMEIAKYSKQEKDTLWDETKRLFNPHQIYVDLSQKLFDVKKELLDEMTMGD
ncbi:MAG: nicotinate phosphoribosyltransferase, partial [Hespellia sp.]|nr:nicotinate phosphoribosyltransferase [Hespellia sp.]